jgi:hypothetical protein
MKSGAFCEAEAERNGVRTRAIRHTGAGTQERRSASAYEERIADENAKQAQRQQVADWFLKHHEAGEDLELLSLPDEHWTFENWLQNEWSPCIFTGVQRDWATFQRSLAWMPGDTRCMVRPVDIKVGRIQCFRRGRNRLFHMDVGHLLGLTRFDRGGGHSRRQPVGHRTATAIWLDLNAQLCPSVQRTTRRLYLAVQRYRPTVPVVISFLSARDRLASDEERVATLLTWMAVTPSSAYHAFRFSHFLKHQSARSPYLSVFGVFQHRQSVPLKARGFR